MGVNFPLHTNGKSPSCSRDGAVVGRKKRGSSGHKTAREESLLQSALLDYLAWTVPNVTAFGIPNAALRTRTGRAANFVPGLRKGVFDLCLILPPHPGTRLGRVVFIEVKSAKGVLSDEQEDFQTILMRADVQHCICRSIDDLREALRIWKVPMREIMPLTGAVA